MISRMHTLVMIVVVLLSSNVTLASSGSSSTNSRITIQNNSGHDQRLLVERYSSTGSLNITGCTSGTGTGSSQCVVANDGVVKLAFNVPSGSNGCCTGILHLAPYTIDTSDTGKIVNIIYPPYGVNSSANVSIGNATYTENAYHYAVNNNTVTITAAE